MKRRAMQLLFAVGLLLTLAAGTLWVRGFWVSDRFCFNRVDARAEGFDVLHESFHVRTSARIFSFWVLRRIDERTPDLPRFRFTHDAHETSASDWKPFAPTLTSRLGFGYQSGGGPIRIHWVSIPAWFAVACCAVVTAVPGRRLHRERRQRLRIARGQCTTCGYDLRGVAHERCPECGATVDAARV